MSRKYLSVSRGPEGFTISIEEDGDVLGALLLTESEAERLEVLVKLARNSAYTESRRVLHAIGIECRPKTPLKK